MKNLATATEINGNRPSFLRLFVYLADKQQPRGIFKSINYTVRQEPGVIYSKSRSEIVGYTPGQSTCTGSFEMLVTEFNDFAADITDKGNLAITTPMFTIQASYSSNPIDVQTDVLLDCRITNIEASNSGTDATSRVCSFTYSQLKTNGIIANGNTDVAQKQFGVSGNQLQPVTSDFWFGPVYRDDNGELFCPGFVGNTYSDSPWDFIGLRAGEGPLEQNEQPKTPGIVEVTFDQGRSFDEKKSAGTDYPRITMHGLEAAKGTFRVTIWTPQQYLMLTKLWSQAYPGPQKTTKTRQVPVGQAPITHSEFFGSGDSVNGITSGQTFVIPQVQKATTKTVKTGSIETPVVIYQVSHPDLASNRVSSVVFTGAAALEPGPTPLSRTFVMRWIQWAQQGTANTTQTPNAAQAYAPLPSTLEQYQPPGTNPDNKGPA